MSERTWEASGYDAFSSQNLGFRRARLTGAHDDPIWRDADWALDVLPPRRDRSSAETGFQGKEGQSVPEMTDDIVNSISERYIELYEKIIGESFVKNNTTNIVERVERNVTEFLKNKNQ